MSESLITKYRPKAFSEVFGNEGTIGALQRVLKAPSRPHSFLFTGPSGIGKTTLARILATEVDAEYYEADAASNNGVDAMRALTEYGQHMSFSKSGKRLITLDEAHALSKNAWQAILKLLEEPPDHLYLALCTTEPSKVPETIVTRCYHTILKPITPQEMDALLSTVSELEGWKVNNDVMQLVIAAGTGQPRKALSVLLKVYDAPSRDEARRIISLPEGSDQLIRILRHLIEGKKSWVQLRPMLLKLEDDNFEETSIAAARYIMGALLNTESQEKAIGIWNLLEALVFPAQTWDKKVAFIAAIGRMLWGGGA